MRMAETGGFLARRNPIPPTQTRMMQPRRNLRVIASVVITAIKMVRTLMSQKVVSAGRLVANQTKAEKVSRPMAPRERFLQSFAQISAARIVNNAPEGRDIEGWRPFDGQRNRYWLMENLTNNRYALVHDAIYNYYRLGMDMMYENPSEGRAAIMNCLNQLNTLNADISNSMIVPFFFQGRSGEIVKLFKKGEGDEKTRAREILVRLDVTNANTYKQELK